MVTGLRRMGAEGAPLRACAGPLGLYLPGVLALLCGAAVVGLPDGTARAETPPSAAEWSPAPAPRELSGVPPELRRWRDWILDGHEIRRCPFLYNDPVQRYCAWPLSLRLELDEQGGSFSADWMVEIPSLVLLPGGVGQWPRRVVVDGAARQPLQQRQDRPELYLEAGWHRLEGRFEWAERPEVLLVPPGSGLLELRLDGVSTPRPRLEEDGRLWLREPDVSAPRVAEAPEQGLDLAVVRLLGDDIPQQLLTRLLLEVSGPEREVLLGELLPAGALPMEVSGQLAARLEEDGRLRVQLRPGSWRLDIRSRQPGPVQSLVLPDTEAPLPREETWAFQAHPQLRQVRLEGAVPVDAGLTRAPPDWWGFPVYQVQAGSELRFAPILEEKPTPSGAGPPAEIPPRLGLEREMWLDFDGQGFTVLDKLRGGRGQSGRLHVTPELRLGRVQLNGEPQYVTRRRGSERWGLNLRGASLDLLAESRYEGSPRHFPAGGWEQSLQKIAVLLHLPPGWRLFTVTGPDQVQAGEDWVRFWNVYKLFSVLFATVVVSWMFNFRWSLVTLLAMVLCWNEFRGFQGSGWFFVLAGLGLLRVLRGDAYPTLNRIVRGYSWAAWWLLVLFQLPFVLGQLSDGIYPQLKYPDVLVQAPSSDGVRHEKVGVIALQAAPPGLDGLDVRGAAPAALEVDPELRLGTGPGLPTWDWRRVRMSWDNPVRQGQRMSLWLISPSQNLLLCVARVFLVLALLYLLLRALLPRGDSSPGASPAQAPPGASVASLWLVGLLLPGLVGVPDAARAEFPSPELLNEYEKRLLQAPECLPECAQLQRLRVFLRDERLELRLEVHAREWVAVPLPGGRDAWLPATLLIADEHVQDDMEGASRLVDNRLLMRMSPGVHQVLAAGPAPPEAVLNLPLALRPQRLELDLGPGWKQDGAVLDTPQGPLLRLRRTQQSEQEAVPGGLRETASVLEPEDFPVFLKVRRRISLDAAQWRVHSWVRLETPAALGTVRQRVPLLPGESVLSDSVTVENGAVLVDLGGLRRELEWESILEERERLELKASVQNSWVESWELINRSQVEVEHQGLQPLPQEQQPSGTGLYWRPWPGERVELRMISLQSVDGPELTIESVQAELRAGAELSSLDLDLQLRAGRAGEEKLLLPPGMQVRSVWRGSSALQVLQQDRELLLELLPGEQHFRIEGEIAEGIGGWFRFPELRLPAPAVNVDWVLGLGRERWSVLMGGPLLGPVVLFWPVLLVIILLALLLGGNLGVRRFTPLRSWHWLLLGLGLTQCGGFLAGLVIVSWFYAMALRERYAQRLEPGHFNIVQSSLVLLTLIFAFTLLDVIRLSLLGQPEMQIAGNGSTAEVLRWFQDQGAEQLPRPWVLSFPMWSYRALTLAWALWLAIFVVKHSLVWGWRCFSTGGLWHVPGSSGKMPDPEEKTP